MVKLNKEWMKVNEQNYTPHQYQAHRGFNNTIRNYLESKSLPNDLDIARNARAKYSEQQESSELNDDDIIVSEVDEIQ